MAAMSPPALKALPAPVIGFPLEKFPWAEAMISFARSLGASRTGDLAAAETEIDPSDLDPIELDRTEHHAARLATPPGCACRTVPGRERSEYDLGMLLLGIILFGMLVGATAQLIVGRSAKGVDWGLALAAGLVGSFIGGLLISLLSGDGLAFRPSGIIGSLAGAIIVTLVWHWWRARRAESRR